jgi:hypothetical protein
VLVALLCILASVLSAAPDPRAQQQSGSFLSLFRIQEPQDGLGNASDAWNEPHVVHHKLLWPLNAQDAVVFLGASVIIFLAAGAGIGGGSVLVPLFLLAGGKNQSTSGFGFE